MSSPAPPNIGLHLARPLFDQSIAVAATDPRAAHHQVLAQEQAALTRTQAGHQKSFAAGRAAVHQAMAQLGVPVQPVQMGADRMPVWPGGLVGSLSHSQTCCIAALGSAERVRALGIAVHEDAPLERDMQALVCTRAEQAWLATRPGEHAGRTGRLILAAKQCANQCQHTLSGIRIGPEMFEITPDPDTGQFEATLVARAGPFAAGTCLSGHFAIGAGLIVAAMTLSA